MTAPGAGSAVTVVACRSSRQDSPSGRAVAASGEADTRPDFTALMSAPSPASCTTSCAVTGSAPRETTRICSVMPATGHLAGAVHLDRRVGARGAQVPGGGPELRLVSAAGRGDVEGRDVPELDVQPADHPAVVDEHALRSGGVDLAGAVAEGGGVAVDADRQLVQPRLARCRLGRLVLRHRRPPVARFICWPSGVDSDPDAVQPALCHMNVQMRPKRRRTFPHHREPTMTSAGRGRGRATIVDVARAAEVSRQTVSNVVNNPQRVAPATLERVHREIERLGFRPSLAARSLKQERANALGIELNSLGVRRLGSILDSFFVELTVASRHRDAHLVPFAAAEHDRPIPAYQDLVASNLVDAFILTDTRHDDPRPPWLRDQGLPFAAFGRIWDDPSFTWWVDVDGRAGVTTAVRHLLEAGYDRVGFLGWPSGSPVGDERREGWLSAARRPAARTPTGRPAPRRTSTSRPQPWPP